MNTANKTSALDRQQHEANEAWAAAQSTYNTLDSDPDREGAYDIIVGRLHADIQFCDVAAVILATERATSSLLSACSKNRRPRL